MKKEQMVWLRNSRKMKAIAIVLLCSYAIELFTPAVSYALTTGPSQPEVQGFEPVGTTDMVDMFSGDFVYNIPLMDVEGYPVNIAYHGGVTMEQEASWVGLGWNINPGCINRTVRGIPDDFNGDTVAKDISIKPEKTIRIGVGGGTEIAGIGDPPTLKSSPLNVSVNASINVNVSNYKGVSCDFSFGGGINVFHCVSAGVNMGVGSQSGASIDYNAGINLSTSQFMSHDISGGIGVSAASGYSTRSGVKDVNLSFAPSLTDQNSTVRTSFSENIPIGIKNFVPVITNSSTMNSVYGRIKFGVEFYWIYPYGNASGMYSVLNFNNDASRSTYGYMYLQNARLGNEDVLDFSRDRDGMFNKSMQYLPVPHLTYDIYSLSGQGTGGTFRQFRNDFGNVYDPVTASSSTSEQGELEGGIGNLFEVGIDYTHSGTQITSGPWMDYQRTGTVSKGFTSNSTGSTYENVFFKQAGELTAVNPDYFSTVLGFNTIDPDQAMNLPQTKPGSSQKRDARSNLIYYNTAAEASVTGIGTNPNIFSFSNTSFTDYAHPNIDTLRRITPGSLGKKKDMVSEIVQVQKDGKRYVYGIPAMNNVQWEATFSVDPNTANLNDGLVGYSSADASSGNHNGRDNYYSGSFTPPYAHSYLLTSVLSTDYVDVTGDGVTDDDLGNFTKLNYTRTDSDFRWNAPFNADSAQYNPGFWSDRKDDKGSFVCGSRENWILHTIETKNFIAEFYTSARDDAKGSQKAVVNFGAGASFNISPYNTPLAQPGRSFKLDSIKLYNKHDRFINRESAVPIKTVYFSYDYFLCEKVPNGTAGEGKLTLKALFFKYGNSQKSMISPYQFGYGFNPDYNASSKDRWGSYKPNNPSLTNYEFPFVDQNDLANNDYASAWSLKSIKLPSGGVITATYESDDYAFVQDKPADEMFLVQGIGNSPAYSNSNLLYQDKNNPNLYVYFNRRTLSELSTQSFSQNYVGKQTCLGFNFNTRLTGANNTFEQIKGYGNIQEVGPCSDGIHGYIKFQPVNPNGGGSLSPVTYTAINVGRYNLPQVIFPGSNPDETDWNNILAGIGESFSELVNVGKNPVTHMVEQSYARNVNLTKSYIRLQCVGLKKKGGGQRVKALEFNDSWDALTGGKNARSTYGKQYDYTIDDPDYGTISSGVASYEPMIGGDENSMKQPVPYIGQSGSNWPPNDPVDLYQETPIGESLFPSAQIGYRQVTVRSIHADVGRSSKGVDIYQFYTAKDFPAQVKATSIKENTVNHYDFFSQMNLMSATQGYTLIFNDMHGKPRKVEHDVYNPQSQSMRPVSYQIFNYKNKGGTLDNNVKCLAFDGENMRVKNMQLGVEEDITLDSRQKNEITHNSSFNANLNVSIVMFFFIPIPVPIVTDFVSGGDYQNEFQSAAVSKVIQQYGILDNVISYNEGAVTKLQNELYDPNTGQVVATSINNEYQDREYTMNIPAYWTYQPMGPAYNNIKYQDVGTISVGANNIGTLNFSNTDPLIPGDELAVSYKDESGVNQQITAWVLGNIPLYHIDTTVLYHSHTEYTTTDSVVVSYQTKNCYSLTGLDIASHEAFRPVDSTIATFTFNGHLNAPDTCLPDTFSGAFSMNASIYSVSIEDYGISSLTGETTYNYIFAPTLPIATTVEVTLPIGTVSGSVTLTGNNIVPSMGGSTPLPLTTTITIPFTGSIGSYTSVPVDTVYDTFHVTHSHIVTDTAYHYSDKHHCSGTTILPRFPQSTPGWSVGANLTSAKIQVVRSGAKNMLGEVIESYTGLNAPTTTTGFLNFTPGSLINMKATTYCDTNTRMKNSNIVEPNNINPYAIGARGLWRELSEYAYITNRNYEGTSARNSGLFNATSYFNPAMEYPYECSRFPYNYLAPVNYDRNWHTQRTITKWSPNGKEIENIDAIGNFSTAVYGYNETLPLAVVSNARQGEILSDGFEDYNLLQESTSLLSFCSSPFSTFPTMSLGYSSFPYLKNNLLSSGQFNIVDNYAHTGNYSLHIMTESPFELPLNNSNYFGIINYYNDYYSSDPMAPYHFSSANEYLPFEMNLEKTYHLSLWFNNGTSGFMSPTYSLPSGCGVTIDGASFYPFVAKSNIIDGWQQYDVEFKTGFSSVQILLPFKYYVDDIRVFPVNGNMKSFVYGCYNQKLMATLDENNFATIYEYDQEGNLVRVKKETTKGIMTQSESRSGNPKMQ